MLAARRPGSAFRLGLALLLVNLAGIAAAVMPFLTITIAYSFVAVAHFALHPDPGSVLMAPIMFEHVTKRFDDTTAVDDLSIEVADGEFLVLVGPSGCGKTTALRMLAGLEDSRTAGSSSATVSSTTSRPARATWRWSSSRTRCIRT